MPSPGSPPPPRTCGSLVDLNPRETDRWLRVFLVPEGGVDRARVLWVDRERRILEEVPSWWEGGKLQERDLSMG